MASVIGEEKKGRRKAPVLLLLFGACLCVFAAFWVTGDLGINPAWVFAAVGAAGFFAVVGWGYRIVFRSPEFVVFFAIWTLVHVIVYLVVLGYLGILYYVPIVVLELWLGYTIAILRFGPPPGRGLP